MKEKIVAGRYQIIESVREEPFRKFYLAKDNQLPGYGKCIIQQLEISQVADSLLRKLLVEQFELESQILGSLDSCGQISQILAFVEEDNDFYLVQEHIDGYPLSQDIAPEQITDEAQVTKILKEILEVLSFLHNRRIVYGNITPSSIVRRKIDGKLVFTDFSLASLSDQARQALPLMRPPSEYIPAKRVQDNGKLASDIYAVGMIGIQALTGLDPKKLIRDTRTSKLMWESRIHISRGFHQVLTTMVNSKVNLRYQSATEALQEIERLKKKLAVSRSDAIAAASLVVGLLGLPATWLALPMIQQWFESKPNLEKTTNEILYINKQEGIQLKYLKADWELQEEKNPLNSYIVKLLNINNGTGVFPTEITIEIEKLEPPLTLDEYTTSSIEEITRFLPKAKILDSQPTTLSRQRAHKIIYLGKYEGDTFHRKSLQVWTLKRDKAFIVTYTSDEQTFDKVLEIVQKQIIPSFEIY
jgi:serine/threonine protein kinase